MSELFPYQIEGARFLERRRRAILADVPGLGKSAQALHAAVEPVLVVAPAMLAGTWLDEVGRWAPGLDWTFTSYQSVPGRKANAAGHMRLTTDRPREELTRPWGTVIVDEVHHVKNRKAKSTKAVERLGEMTNRLYLLTGTPIPNWAHELYFPLRLVHGRKDRRFSSYWRWIETWFTTWASQWSTYGRDVGGLREGITWGDFVEGTELGDIFLQRLRDDVLEELPPLTETYLWLDMVPRQRAAYEEMKRDYLAWVGEGAVHAFDDGARYIRLAQLTTGLETLDPSESGSCKLDALVELVPERVPVVVFAQFRNTVVAAAARLAKAGFDVATIMGGVSQAERDDIRRRFQGGDLDVLVGTLDTVSEGLTLTRADTAIFVERSWRPSRNEQARRRVHRIGQERPVSIVHLVTSDALDERILALLEAKTDQQIKALTAARFAALL